MIYFDSAATSFQKPETVSRAMQDAMETMSSPGRGGYPEAMRAADAALECRTELQQMFHTQTPEQVVFTMNATHALNIAIKSLVPPHGRAVISGYEHNAVTRPLAALGAEIDVADTPLFHPELCAKAFEQRLTTETDAVICTHVSNVFGYAQPVEELAELCRRHGVPLIIDASQSAGILPLDLQALGAAYIAMPGHKGLYGPQGTGVLLCGGDAAPHTLLEGGTGSISASQEMPDFLPDRLEAGTHNMPGIAGLLAGVRFVRERGLGEICMSERRLALLAADGLRRLPDLRVFAEQDLRAQTGVVSFVCKNMDTERMGRLLSEQGIAVRAGLHCAPLAHGTAGTRKTGTIRVSFSAFNTDLEVLRFLDTVSRIQAGNIE
jgi:cysteine desulfurase family protein